MSLDVTSYYRLTNSFLGPGQSLDVKADGSGRLKMAGSGDYSGQFWRLADLGGGRYALRTRYLGDCFSLDVINDGKNDTPWLAATGNYSGQFWTLTPWGDGTYKLFNDFTGSGKSLDVYRDSHEPFLDTGDHSGQHWTLTALGAIPSTDAIPELAPLGSVYHTEGPSDYGVYARPQGTIKAVMVFVDFPDAPAGTTSTSDTADHLLGHGKARQLYLDQSYGKLTLDVDVRAELGWRRMPRPSTAYSFVTFNSHMAYITDAAALFPRAAVDFSAYRFVFIVAARTPSLPLSPAFNARPGTGTPSPSGEIRLAVTFGQDSYSNRYITVIHEVGHLFDLPDLYPAGGSAPDSKAGCWDIMSDIFHSISFLGWHRHKNGWLEPSRATYLQATSTWYGTLSPLSGGCGLSMLVLSVDRGRHPSKVFVIEVAQPVLGTDEQYRGEGILLYTVDATVATLSSPVVVIPKTTSDSPVYGALFEAPYGVGDHVSVTDRNASLELTVLQKFGSSYNIKVEYRRSSSWVDALLDALLDVTAAFVRLVPFLSRFPASRGPWSSPRSPVLIGRDG